MKNNLLSLMVVSLGLILAFLLSCSKDEPESVIGNPDIGYEGFKSDAELFYEFAYRKESLILNALNYTSDGFTKAPFEGNVSEEELELFFSELEELKRKADGFKNAITKLESSGVLQRTTQTRGLFSSTKDFFTWISGSGERNRERITTIASNMNAAERSKLYNGLPDTYKNKANGEADFWQKLQKGDLDSSAGSIYNDFYHNTDTEFSDLAQDKGLTPQQIVVMEGAKGIETGANVAIDATSAVVPGFDLGTKITKVGTNVEKMTKSNSWKEAAQEGFHAASEILELWAEKYGVTVINGGDAVIAIRNKVDETVFKENDKKETKGKVKIKEKNPKESTSIVIVEKKGGGTSNDGSPSIYTTTKSGISDGIDMLIKAGKWLVTIINENGQRGTVEVEVKEGKTTITEVVTGESTDEEDDEIDSKLFSYMLRCVAEMRAVYPDVDDDHSSIMGTSNEFYDSDCGQVGPVKGSFANNIFNATYSKTCNDDFYGTMVVSGSVSLTIDKAKKRVKTGTIQLIRNIDQPTFESVSEEVFKINLQDFPFKVEDDKVIIDYSGDIVKEFKSVSWQLSYSQPYGSDELDFDVKKISLHIEFAEKPE